MRERTFPPRYLLELRDLPLVICITDDSPSSLRERAQEQCDGRFGFWSRSYSGRVALIAGSNQRVGVDVELTDLAREDSWSLTNEWFRSSMLTSEERVRIASDSTPGTTLSATSVWSSKEAVAKALGTPRQFDPTRLTGAAVWKDARRGRWRAAYLDLTPLGLDAVAWMVYEDFA